MRSWSASRVGYAEMMAVDLSPRRMGVGRALMNAIPDEFHRNQVEIVNLDVPAELEATVGLYRGLGFSMRAYNQE